MNTISCILVYAFKNMFGIVNFEFYILATIVFIMTPGMDTIFVLNSSLGENRKIGIYSALGVNAGILVHTFFAAFGLSLILAQSAIAFMIIKYVGAAYLIYIGLISIFKKSNAMDLASYNGTKVGNWDVFKRGLITNVLNPKVALFFLSFFPQFVNHDAIGSSIPFLILGFSYVAMGIVWYVSLVLFVGLFANKLKKSTVFQKYMHRISGVIFVLMGLKVAFTKN